MKTDTKDIRNRLSNNTVIDAKEIQALCDFKDKFLPNIMEAYQAGGGDKKEAIKYIHDVYGYVYTNKSNP